MCEHQSIVTCFVFMSLSHTAIHQQNISCGTRLVPKLKLDLMFYWRVMMGIVHDSVQKIQYIYIICVCVCECDFSLFLLISQVLHCLVTMAFVM